MGWMAIAGSLPVLAQAVNIQGTVKDATGEPLIGVSVVQVDVNNGAVTDLDGRFSIDVPQGATLRFSYIGYETLELPARPGMNVQLKESRNQLEEIVVVGYGTVKRKDVTTAVSTVSTQDLDERPIISAGQAIQGKAAGVSVIQPNGAPGAETIIRVRGTTSYNGSNSPLYVVDGVPVDNLNFLAPTDIANIQILKDASSAAIYGSRGANGVIIITTKAGAAGNAKITFNAQLGTNNVVNKIKSLNAAQYKELIDEIRPGAIPAGTTDVTDWFNEVYQTGVTQNYQVSVSDGNEKMRYFLSGGLLDEKGVLDAAFFKRYNFRANIDSKIRPWLNINANVSYSDNSKNGITTGRGSNRGGVVLAIVNLPTAIPVINEQTDYYNRNFFGQNIVNPVEALANGKDDKEHENRLIASGNATITFMPGLTFKSSLTLDRRNYVQTGFSPVLHYPETVDKWGFVSTGIDEYGSGWDNRNMNTVLTFDNVATFNRSFNKHNLEIMAGSSWTDSDYTNSWMNASYYRDNSIKTLNAANKVAWENATSGGTGTGASQWGILSYFGRASYNFDSKYLITANMRADGSSKLHPNYRWGTFPSFSAAWRLSSEEFMSGLDWINDLKIRGGWGQTGNQSGIGDYAYLLRYNITRQPWMNTVLENGAIVYPYDRAVPLISESNLRTSDLTWETTTQTNIGVDWTLLNSRITLAMDYYYKRTTDMLMDVSLPEGGSYASSIARNEGEMSNRGFEFSIDSRNLQGIFQWNTNFNISFNKNRLEKLQLQQIYYDAETTDAFHQTRIVRNEPGRPLGGFYGYISDGVDPETGELKYRDMNKDGKLTATDRTYIGDPNPDFTYGITNNFSWKNFNLSIFIQGSYGNDIFNASKGDTEGMYDLKNQSVNVLKRWRTPGQITDVPKAGFNIQPSSYFIEDGSYLRVKDVSLSYNFRGGILKKWGINRLQPYFTANNLLTLTKYKGMDPEVNQWGGNGHVQGIDWGTYPHSKSYVFGINVEF
ncbi:SusC/RagA family TonB-linked outer membrane protein [Bacteroidia bacterium]|nr:SusC/RagA family TonB-linked outer membrane protein [Bacteroidia bacterium]